PYRQSDRKEIYHQYAHELVERGHAYYAFDTPDELEQRRQAEDNFTCNHLTRGTLTNSLTLGMEDARSWIEEGRPYVVRLKVEPGREIRINDLVRGEVTIQSGELDDKVLLKADGMPTYHLANVVDDHLMRITHVIRGEEWLPSTAHHVLLYEGFGWSDTMPAFSHLPLILKPVGSGKLSKRDGAKFGMPVFPLSWNGETPEDSFEGFREAGFLPEAMINFLALLGWHPGGDRELFTLDELISEFTIEHIGKSGARFDFEKAKWFNQKYIQSLSTDVLASLILPHAEKKGYKTDMAYLGLVASLMRERVTFIPDFVEAGYYFFEPVKSYDQDTIAKKWNENLIPFFNNLTEFFSNFEPFEVAPLEEQVKGLIQTAGYKPGDILPLLRIAFVGTMKGPAVFDTVVALGREESAARIQRFLEHVSS
ncbi:MAG: glutamate--tRNA ligase, partial [Bacteroidota bacterium]